jgi:hypothetical protein
VPLTARSVARATLQISITALDQLCLLTPMTMMLETITEAAALEIP